MPNADKKRGLVAQVVLPPDRFAEVRMIADEDRETISLWLRKIILSELDKRKEQRNGDAQ